MMNVQGQKMFQVVGDAEVTQGGGGGPAIPVEDVELVAAQTGASREDARKALEECDGEPAEAIVMLMSK